MERVPLRSSFRLVLFPALFVIAAGSGCRPGNTPVQQASPSFVASPEITAPTTSLAAETETAGPTPVVYVSPLPTSIPVATIPPGIDPSGQEIDFWHLWGFGMAAEGLEEIITEFNASNEWGITVTGVHIGNQLELQESVSAGIVAGELPNLAPGFPNSLAAWYAAGALVELQPYLADPVFGLTAEQFQSIYPANLASGRLPNGVQIGLPMHQSLNVLFYNYTWAEELGFTRPPATSAEFKTQACAAAAANSGDADPGNDGTGGLVLFNGASNIASWLFAFGGQFQDDSGEGYHLNTTEMRAVAFFLKDLQDSGCTLTTDGFPNPEFASRQALFVTSSTAGIPFQLAAFEAAGNSDRWGLIPFPGPDGRLAVNAFGQLIALIDKTPEANLAAWLWLRYLISPEVQARWVQAGGYYPSQALTEAYLEDYLAANPIYASGTALEPFQFSEPNRISWGAVRGVLQDAFDAILMANSDSEIDELLVELETTAAELLVEIE